MNAQDSAKNVIGTKLSIMRALHRKGVTKVQLPTREEISRIQVQQLGSNPAQNQGIFARLSAKVFGSSPNKKDSSVEKRRKLSGSASIPENILEIEKLPDNQ